MADSSKNDSKTYIFDIHDMTCASCAAKIESVLEKSADIDNAEVNFALSRAVVTSKKSASEIIDDISGVGYTATQVQQKMSHKLGEGKLEDLKTLLCLVAALPFIFEMTDMLSGKDFPFPIWAQFIVASIIQFGFGWPFYKSSYKSLKHGLWNMDVLVVLGTTAAWCLSTYLWVLEDKTHLYYEASALIITFVLIGRWLESRSQRATHQALTTLTHLRPDVARVIRHGTTMNISVEEVVLEDTLIVRPGERVACDGIVIDGESQIDTSLLTGENMPTTKRMGDRITGGVLNLSSVLHIQVKSLPQDSRLQKIIEYVADASAAKPPIQRLVDRASRYFTPTIIVVSFITFIGWILYGMPMEQSLIRAITVLVIACPCALGLAAPTAMIVGTGIAASRGILTKKPAAIELFRNVTTVVLDKTGTLTKGKPDVTDVASESIDQNELVSIVASLQKNSQHPIAQSVIRYAHANNIDFAEPKDFKAIHGRGVVGEVNGKMYFVGSRQFMSEHSIDTFEYHADFEKLASQGKTLFWIADENELLGYFAVKDVPRPSSVQTISQLKSLGLKVVMLTGDSVLSAQSVASDLGIDVVVADMTPESKAEYLRGLQDHGEVVVMVGDGVNDAPALVVADVSVAMGGGTDVAKDSSSFSLMRDDPSLIPLLIHLGRKMTLTIKQNLFWAFFYNVLCVPLAMFGIVSPAFAGAAMAMSDICVIGNALLLKWRVRGLTTTKASNEAS